MLVFNKLSHIVKNMLKRKPKMGASSSSSRQRGRGGKENSMTPNGEKGSVRISGITVTPRALSRITLFFTVSSAQTITNSTNETLQYRENRDRRRQMSTTLRCSRQSQNYYATLSDFIRVRILKALLRQSFNVVASTFKICAI